MLKYVCYVDVQKYSLFFIYLPSLYSRSQTAKFRGCFQGIGVENVSPPVYTVRDGAIRSLEPIEMGMYGLSALLAHQPCSEAPTANPRYYMVLQ